MNTKFEEMFKTLNKFLDLLKDIKKETIFSIREILGNEVLVNYENIFDVSPLETKKNIQNFIMNQINMILEDLNTINKFDKNVYNEFIKTNLVLDTIDIEKISYVIDKIKDPDAYSLIGHKLTLEEKTNELLTNLGMFINMGLDKNLESDFKVIIDKYNDLLSLVDGNNCECSYDNSLLIKLDFRLPTVPVEKIDTLLDFETNLPNINAILDLKIESIKQNIKDIKLYGTTGEKLNKNILNIISEYSNGIINNETFDYKVNQIINNLNFFVNLQLSYLDTVNNYLEYVSKYTKAYNFLKDNIEVIYNIFNKSN